MFVGSGESMVATLNLHGINGRALPTVEPAAQCAQHMRNPLGPGITRFTREPSLLPIFIWFRGNSIIFAGLFEVHHGKENSCGH